ncbi:hypothetical protein AB852_32325 [Streptomyces uncialis]|uniref:HTH cro/C1-type domain-containing protein n=1 Tax=Streptomyces uncialis TaxID=1048205 RepID=A0A1Q4V000_9ACTN|nr:hypothetical protein AB852_32325 [Streptomyces uncialis]
MRRPRRRPAASPLKYFGSEVRLERERLGWTRKELGKEAHCGYSLVAKIESGERVPGLDFARTCDRVFPHANGRFERLWPLALRLAFPPWFRRYAELEWKATVVRMFHPQLLPGLVQTPDYARAILEGADVVHVDGFPRGFLLAEPDDVAKASEAYDLLTAMACSPDESADLIDSIAKDHYS